MAYEPIFDRCETYLRWMNKLVLWENDTDGGWESSSRAYFESTYIHAGISNVVYRISGPDAQKLISYSAINNVMKWKVNRCKHLVQLDENGLIANHGLFWRTDEDVFYGSACDCTPLMALMQQNKYDCKIDFEQRFIFQFSGPRSLTVIERVTQTGLHDVRFLEVRPVSIPGIDCDGFEVCRIGMSGTLAYELRGPAEWGSTVYKMACDLGQQDGIKRLGMRNYTVNHTFGGYPQMACSFLQSYYGQPWYDAMSKENFHYVARPSGSVDPANMRARYRSAVEVNWAWMADFDHDFVGKDALKAEMDNPQRALVALEWNKEDLIDIYASQFTDEPYKYMEMPSAVNEPAGDHQDLVCDTDGNPIGFSAVPVYGAWYHTTISEAVISIDKAKEGEEVVVQWGDFGGKIKDVRATVVHYPYIGDDLNSTYDLSTVPSGLGE